jgi:hypothetical protein
MAHRTAAGTPQVFISYRRSDAAGHAGRLHDAMVVRFGEQHVFMDVDLQPGVDFVERISTVVSSCHVLLVVIGPQWVRPADPGAASRLEDPDDFVRLEVAIALKRSDVTVIPLLVEDARMPDPDDLPEDLRPLTRRNALELNDMRWRADIGRLLDVMETLLAAGDQPAGDMRPVSGPRRPSGAVLALGLSALAVVAIAVVVLGSGGGGGGDRTTASRPATNTASSETVRPPGVPSNCTDVGRKEFVKDMSALRLWQCSYGDIAKRTTNPSLSYLAYGNAGTAGNEFVSTSDFERKHGWEDCPRSPEIDGYAGDVYCKVLVDAAEARKQSTAVGTIELLWHAPGARVLGHSTFDPLTKVPDAVAAWSQVADAA